MTTDRGNASERPRVVAEARRWIGTPYHPAADVLGAGVDCGMLIVRVFVDTGLVPPFDPRPYPPDWHLHRSEERYLGFVFDRCHEVPVADAAPGDVIVFRYGRCHAHGGIVIRADPAHPGPRLLAGSRRDRGAGRAQRHPEPGRPRAPRLQPLDPTMSIFRSRHSAAVQPDFSGLAIQTATAAAPIPISYGVTRLAPNIIWQNGVAAVPQYQSSGGKGGGKTVSGYEYYTWVMYAIGEGPVRSVGTIYNGQAIYPYGSYGLSLLPGTTPQAPWAPALANAVFAPAALNYNGTAYMASSDFDLGSSASNPSIAFEVYGLLQATAQTVNLYDSDPAICVQDFLTNPQYGVGFPPASISATTLFGAGGDASYQSYCKATGLAFSPALTDQETANSILARWLQLTNTAAIWSGGQLKFVPYGDTAVTATATPTTGVFTVPAVLDQYLFVAPTQTIQVVPAALFVADDGVTYAANGTALAAVTGVPTLGQYAVSGGLYTFSNADSNAQVRIGFTANPAGTYAPNVTPVAALDDDDFVTEDGQDPVQVARVDPYAVANVQRLECFDRSNQYAATPVEARDQNAIEQFGLRIGSTITAHEICDLGIGLIAAQLILQRGLYVRNTYSFKLSWEYCLLEPMDIVAPDRSGPRTGGDAGADHGHRGGRRRAARRHGGGVPRQHRNGGRLHAARQYQHHHQPQRHAGPGQRAGDRRAAIPADRRRGAAVGGGVGRQ